MKLLIAVLSFCCVSVGYAQQNVEFEKKNFPNDKEGYRIAVDEYKRGEELYHEGPLQYKNALKHLKKANAFNPDNAWLNYMIGDCIIETIHKAESIKYFERAYKLNPNVHHEVEYNLGKAHHVNEDWDQAVKWYKLYEERLLRDRSKKNQEKTNKKLQIYEKHIKECKIGKELMKKPIRVFIDNIGPVINTEYPEYGPVITADNSTMYFTSRRPGTIGSHERTQKDIDKDRKEERYYEDIYVTHRFGNGKWSKPKNLGDPINTKGHDATVAILPDGQHMIFYNAGASSLDGGLYEALLKGDEWSHPEKLDKHINSKYHESSAAYSLDKKTIYFVSSKPEDNLGGIDNFADESDDDHYTHDIFYCTWDEEKERWNEAVNIGPTINTKYNERGVFLHSDGKTLYFSSEGHNSMGGYDIFKSIHQEDGSWSEPENLGYPVNGPDHDIFFTLSADGRKGYYASEHSDGFGKQDIYEITFLGPEKDVINLSEDNLLASVLSPVSEKIVEPIVEVSASQTTILKGIVIDAVTEQPIEANIDLTDNTKNNKVATFTSNSKSGKFLVSLPSGKNYGIAVLADGYLFHSENFDIPKAQGYQEVYKEIRLKKVAVGESIILKNIFFDFDKATLRDESIPELARLISLLKEVPTMKIEISGHTDSRGTNEYNQRLSENRSKSVVNYLVKNGIAAKRLQYKGYGESKPIATNDTDDGRQQNRRTEFTILSK